MRLLIVGMVIMLAFGTLPTLAGPPEGTEAQGQPTRFRSIYVEHDATIAGNLTTSGDITLGDDLTVPGDLKVGNGTPTIAQDGEDTYVEGQFEVDGEAQFDGAIDANSTVQIDGATTVGIDGTSYDVILYSDTAGDYLRYDQSDERLVITGTNAANALELADGNLYVADNADADGSITAGSLVVEGTSDLQGNVSDSGGVLTVADNAAITGAADAIQLTVTGYTTQTNVLQTWEQSGGADVATMSNAGLLTTAGGVTTSNGDVTVADDFIVTGQTIISVTASSVITPTGSYQPIEAAGNVTATLAGTGFTTGTMLTLVNTDNVTIRVQEGSTAKMTGTETDLGQYDSLLLWFNGTYWIELAAADN
jgi:cytoskeletal protein CcmA (bactofilin family)